MVFYYLEDREGRQKAGKKKNGVSCVQPRGKKREGRILFMLNRERENSLGERREKHPPARSWRHQENSQRGKKEFKKGRKKEDSIFRQPS